MLLSVFRRWRAGRFADLLDQPPTDHLAADQPPAREAQARRGPRHLAPSRSDQRLSALAALARRTTQAQEDLDLETDPRFRADLRAELMATVERRAAGTIRSAVPSTRVTRR